MKEDFFLLLMISKHWTGIFFPGKSAFVDFTTQLLGKMKMSHAKICILLDNCLLKEVFKKKKKKKKNSWQTQKTERNPSTT